MVIIENLTGAHTNTFYTNFSNGAFTHRRPIYPGDIVHIDVEHNQNDVIDGSVSETITPVSGPLTARLADPTHLERTDAGTAGPDASFRVLAEPGTEIETRIFLTSPNVEGEIEVVLKIGVLPLDIDPVLDVRKRSRAEMGKLRRKQRSDRGKLRAEKRAGDPDRDFKEEKKDLRAAQKAERKALKAERKAGIATARQQRKDDIAASYKAHGKYACTGNQRQTVTRSLREAVSKIESALGNIKPGQAADKYRADALARCFNLDVAKASPDDVRRIQQKAVDVLNIARSSIYVSNPNLFRCGAEPAKCDAEAAAFVTDNVRGNPVTVCQVWLDGNLEFEATKNDPQGHRAYALIHEFVHLAGVTDRQHETYLHKADWSTLTPQQAETMADAFAAFCWIMGSPGLE